MEKRIIFIDARFRTGSTMLWNLFRQMPEVKAFYEPLHEHLTRFLRFPVLPAKDHLFVESYFDEYQGAELALKLHRSEFASSRLYLDRDDDYLELKQYIQSLIDFIPDQQVGVFKFNRIDFRLDWIQKNFPQAFILHLYRDPRTQWYSSLSKYQGDIDQDIECDEYALSTWALDLYKQFPFLATPHIEHAYQRFYYLWKLSYLAGVRAANISVRYEELLSKPEETLTKILKQVDLYSDRNLEESLRFVVSKPKRTWIFDRPEEWFSDLEQKCESTLEDLKINSDFGLVPLKEIQKSTLLYQDLLNDPRNQAWAEKSFQRKIMILHSVYYERDFAQQRTINEQEQKIAKITGEAQNLIVRLEASLNEVKSLSAQLEVSVQEIQNLNIQLERNENKNQELRAEQQASLQEIEHLNNQIAASKRELNGLQQQLDEVLSSRSYRITAPFRAIFGLARKLRG